jgi:hypothetical protein
MRQMAVKIIICCIFVRKVQRDQGTTGELVRNERLTNVKLGTSSPIARSGIKGLVALLACSVSTTSVVVAAIQPSLKVLAIVNSLKILFD